MVGLKNLKRDEVKRFGRTTWELRDLDGVLIEGFSYFCQKNLGYAFATQKRYALVIARFLDYLIEAGAFGREAAPTKRFLNEVIDAYPILLRDGSEVLRTRLNEGHGDAWLTAVCCSLHYSPIKPNSFSNTLAAINRFLRLSEALAVEAYEKASLYGVVHQETYSSLITALSGWEKLSLAEKRNLRINSVLGGVMRTRQDGMRRPRRLTVDSQFSQLDRKHLDFPITSVFPLSSAATSWRDRALWLLLAASGIRVSEALNLQWSDIDIPNQKVFVLDPNGRRLGGDITADEKLRFKGRELSMTYLIQPFRQAFFQALESYVKQEYVPPRSREGGEYVFQYVESHLRGKPYVGVSDAALGKAFKSACARAEVPYPIVGRKREWTLHSLRHLYGVYMLNDFPVDPASGKFGLELSEVQALMGHKCPSSTRIYARKTRTALERVLRQADEVLLGLSENQMLELHPSGS